MHDLARKNYKEKISGPYIELVNLLLWKILRAIESSEERDKIIVINALNDDKIEILPIMGGEGFGANQLRDNLMQD